MLELARAIDFPKSDPRAVQVRSALLKFQWVTAAKVDLPLVELEAARENMEIFLANRLHEMSSQRETKELFEELSKKLATQGK